MTIMTKELSKGSEQMIRYSDYCKTVQNRMHAHCWPATNEPRSSKRFSKLVSGMTFVSLVLFQASEDYREPSESASGYGKKAGRSSSLLPE